MGDLLVYPNKGNVSFGSGKDCWAFSLTKFARIYGKKFGIDEKKMMERLWGENYFDAKAKKWKKEAVDDEGKPLKRAFCNFIMDPIIKLTRAIIDGNKETSEKMLTSLDIKVTGDAKEYQGK